jgi:WD40 repeat protein
MRTLFVVLLTLCALFAKDITPTHQIKASGNVLDFEIYEGKLYVATDNSIVDIFDMQTTNLQESIQIPKIEDFMGETIGAKIYSVDLSPDKKSIMILAEGEKGSREIYIKSGNELKKIITRDDRLFMKKAKFLNNTQILIALMGNELILYDMPTSKKLYQSQLNQSSFSDFAFSKDKSLVASTCESGEIFLVDPKNAKVTKTLSGANKDNIYKVAFVKRYVSGAGQDRKGSLYDLVLGGYTNHDADFLIYATALSPSEKYVAYAFNEENHIAIFDIASKQKSFVLKGQKSTLNAIRFIDETTIVSGSDDKYIMIWKLQ